ncbi:phosphoadenosine phosphosulfate reductase [Elizabethkingia meningoseptica]|uniref:Adenosine 5'-phosphosulfate reductase n=1 Tax=Elizabethkingia meningoseptica TaxID=238 RepID=A0A1V3TY48_ELIME|nr:MULTISPECIES: phosphoadenylyl-sulfate reductase [Elizabethkingia]AQX12475.1 phosphoadenosine phosphosulfate reductase [Elizabethkingia meningoseptica]MBG0514015.1 phosphoadenylyl-sulfate reductase [Elizabethkingia meningoseptica]MDE5432930.1 phosphoadenylyl-sulfate reductase [Elizabethkingia meningoseptica]MDE5450489.1 phosphoadenylyl-sulfate reductase [Elizabethkingia meningoseptica]MDE5471639.1 phosphoadenylyl-sulfate reductase [Elizabethkingia meningoseptica]
MENSLKIQLNELLEGISENSSGTDFLQLLVDRFPNEIIFSTSFSYEDQVVTHLIKNLDIAVFTLDTGRLFEQTYETWSATKAFFKKEIKAYYPDAEQLRQFVTENGPDSFYRSVENRKACCDIRKVQPLKKALQGYKVWITGLRAEHSANRQNMSQLEWDADNQIIKYHPLLHWTSQQVKDYVKENRLPYNYLHEKGFVSIGCAPCTRAIQEGEDFRAGRWWWEDANKKECGLHIHQ